MSARAGLGLLSWEGCWVGCWVGRRDHAPNSCQAPQRVTDMWFHSPRRLQPGTPPPGMFPPWTSAGAAATRSRPAVSYPRRRRPPPPRHSSLSHPSPANTAVAIIHADGTVEANPNKRLIKEDIIATYGLNPRDLRSLDAHILDVRPSLLVCEQALVACVPIARAIIARDHIICKP